MNIDRRRDQFYFLAFDPIGNPKNVSINMNGNNVAVIVQNGMQKDIIPLCASREEINEMAQDLCDVYFESMEFACMDRYRGMEIQTNPIKCYTCSATLIEGQLLFRINYPYTKYTFVIDDLEEFISSLLFEP